MMEDEVADPSGLGGQRRLRACVSIGQTLCPFLATVLKLNGACPLGTDFIRSTLFWNLRLHHHRLSPGVIPIDTERIDEIVL
jgi:hypothetical protein